MGIAAPFAQAAELAALGAGFLTEGVGRFLAPDQPEEVFAANLAGLAAAPLPVLACNGFIRPAHLRCVGADANHDLVLEWADTTFRRAERAGARFIVFGSAGARQLRDGWPQDQADTQFVALLRRMAPLAEARRVVVALEQLQASECNYINHIGEGAAIVRAVGHPHVRLLADLYHMARMGDTPADLRAAMDVVAHVEIAEQAGRTAPGVAGDDFRPWFRVLRAAGYRGAICIEGRWQIDQIGNAFAEIARQAAEA
jgi:sugar phosphate isomerase/epimerase